MKKTRFIPSDISNFGDVSNSFDAEAVSDIAYSAGQVAGAIVSGISQNKLQQQQLAHEKKMTKLNAKYSEAEAGRLSQEGILASQQVKLAFGNVGKILLIGGSVVAIVGIIGYTVIQLKKPAK